MQASLLDKITLVIPTHYRHHYLERLLNYFKGSSLKILVADSTNVPFAKKNDFDIEYLHYPNFTYLEKLSDCINRIKTPYTVMCADDDFIVLASLLECATFLEKNADYSFCQGYSYMYQTFNEKIVFWLTRYNHNCEYDDPKKRFYQFNSTPYYGLNRTENLKQWLSFLEDFKAGSTKASSSFYIDNALTKIVAINGKSKLLKIPFGIREYASQLGDGSKLHETLFDINPLDYYRKLSHFIEEHLQIERFFEQHEKIFLTELSDRIKYDFSMKKSKEKNLKILSLITPSYIKYLYRKFSMKSSFKGIEFIEARKYLDTEHINLIRKSIISQKNS